MTLALSFCSNVFADNWTNSNDIKSTFINYQGNTTRKNLTDLSINIQTHYLDKFDLLFAYNHTKLNAGQGNSSRQNQLTVGANWFQYFDKIEGRIGWQLKNYSLTTPSNTIADITSGGISYLDYQKSFYLDTLFTQSQYINKVINDYTVNQANLSFEFSPRLKSSWLSFQLIAIDNADNLLFDSTLYSANFEWTQFLYRTGFPLPMRFIIGLQIGEQRYLVLQRLNSVNNSPDAQTASYWVNATWHISDNSQLGLSIATSEHQTDLQEKYNSTYSSILLNIKW